MARILGLLILGFIVLLGLLTHPATATPPNNGPNKTWMYNQRIACYRKKKNLPNALNQFCKGGFRIGRYDYKNGVFNIKQRKYRGGYIESWATCNAGDWVPEDWCRAQMYDTCARGDKNGHGWQKYAGGCQWFTIRG